MNKKLQSTTIPEKAKSSETGTPGKKEETALEKLTRLNTPRMEVGKPSEFKGISFLIS